MDLKDTIRSIKDFPEEGIIFRDITTLLKNPAALKQAVDQIEEQLKDVDYDIIVAPESRGFIFGMPLAYNTGKGFVPIRKKGKLPAETISKEYALEYGTDSLEIDATAIKEGGRCVIVDDLLATGGTALATAKLIEQAGGVVAGIRFAMELTDLPGRSALEGYDVDAVIKY